MSALQHPVYVAGAWGAEARAVLHAHLRACWPLAIVLEGGLYRHVAVISAGIDGGLGMVSLRSAA